MHPLEAHAMNAGPAGPEHLECAVQAVLYGPAGQDAVQVRVSWAGATRAWFFLADVWKPKVGLVDFFVVVGGGRVS